MVSTFEPNETGHLLRVLLVDGRPERRELIRHLVQGTGLAEPDVQEAGSSPEAVELLDRVESDIAVVEIQMPVDRGLEAIAALRSQSSELRIVVCSFHADPETKRLALGGGADMYLEKPVSSNSLKGVFREFFPETRPPLEVRTQEPSPPTVG